MIGGATNQHSYLTHRAVSGPSGRGATQPASAPAILRRLMDGEVMPMAPADPVTSVTGRQGHEQARPVAVAANRNTSDLGKPPARWTVAGGSTYVGCVLGITPRPAGNTYYGQPFPASCQPVPFAVTGGHSRTRATTMTAEGRPSLTTDNLPPMPGTGTTGAGRFGPARPPGTSRLVVDVRSGEVLGVLLDTCQPLADALRRRGFQITEEVLRA